MTKAMALTVTQKLRLFLARSGQVVEPWSSAPNTPNVPDFPCRSTRVPAFRPTRPSELLRPTQS